MKFSFNLNGEKISLEIEPQETLLEVLRNRLGITSVKLGCGTGECGACVVIKDSLLVNTCILPAAMAEGSSVLTLEGLCQIDSDRPIDSLSAAQRAFLEKGAVQCGYCSSGMIMAAKDLLDRNPHPGKEDIRNAISGNLCRCTGYAKIIEAIEYASTMMQKKEVFTGTNIGRRLAREDVIDHITGTSVFLDEINRPGMAYGAVLRSPHAHAKIISIDASKALAIKGILAFVDGQNLPYGYYGVDLKDQLVFARDKVRYVGEPVGAIAAETEVIAREALKLVDVRYEILPAVFDAREAMKDTAPLIHEKLSEYTLGFDTKRHGNICTEATVDYGDLESGFTESDIILEDEFFSNHQQHATIETHGAVAEWSTRGRVTVWSTTQKPFAIRRYLGQSLQYPFSKIQVHATRVGGGFGSRLELQAEPFAVLLAKACKRPVKIRYSREEDLSAVVARHKTWFRVKSGIKKDGTICAREIEYIYETGAYSGNGPTTLTLATQVSTGLYRVKSQKARGYCVYTNKLNCGSFRGPSAPQTTFALESHTDNLARAIGMDPLEFRLKNLLEAGEMTGFGQKLVDVDFKAVVKKAADVSGWHEFKKNNSDKRYGIGMACVYWLTGGWATSVFVKINEDGTIMLQTGGVDMGTGYLFTSIRQLTAEVFGIPAENIVIVQGDTDLSGYDHGIGGSRGAVAIGRSAIRAAEDARDKLIAAASRQMKIPLQSISVKNGMLLCGNKEVSFSEISYKEHMVGNGPVIGMDSYLPEMEPVEPGRTTGLSFPAFKGTTIGCHVVIAGIDKETGIIDLKKVIAVHDVGKAINPLAVEGQIEGGVALGIGFGLTEEMKYDPDGRMLNKSFADYKVPHSEDIPEIVPVIWESPSRDGPYGAKGIGEPTMAPLAAAVRNAVLDASGIALHETPMTPERNYTYISPLRHS